VVNKRLYLICRDDQATYAITVGARGPAIIEVGQVASWAKEIVVDIMFLALRFLITP